MKSRANLVFAIAALGILGAVSAAYLLLLSEPDPAETIEEVAPPSAKGGFIETASGPVEIRLQGAWQAAAPGSPVVAGSEVRTGRGASASVRYGEAIRLDVQGGTEVKLAQLDDKVARFVLSKEGGVVVAEVAP